MQGDGDAPDVPAVAGGEEGEHADGGVFGGVQGAAEGFGGDAGGVELVLGDGPPHGAGAQRPGRQVQLGLAEDLAGDEFATEEGDDLVGDFDGAEAEAGVPPGDLGGGLQDGDGRGVAGRRRVGRVGLLDQGDGIVQVEPAHQVAAALVEVDGALVDGGVGGGLVHGAQEPARALLDDLDGAAALAPDVGEVGGPLAAGPVPGGAAAAEQSAGLELRDHHHGLGAEEGEVGLGQGQFLGRGAQVGGEDVGVVRVEDGGLHGLPEEGLGVVDEEGVQGVVAGDEDGEGALARAAGAAGLLPEGGPGAGVAGEEDGVEAGDVDAQLEGRGGGEAQQLAGVQGALDGAALLGEVAAAVGGDAGGEGAVHGGEPFLGDQGDELGAASGADEGDGAHPLDGEVGEQVGGLGGGGAADGGAPLAVELGERGLPEGEDEFAAR